MNWYKKAQSKAELRGEWWFRHGNADFADGDIGDYNHAAMAIESAHSEVLDSFFDIVKKHREKLEKLGIWNQVISKNTGYDYDNISLETFKDAIDIIMDAEDSSVYDEVYSEIVSKHGLDCFKAAMGDGDAAISWGLKQGWVRCHGNYLEVWTLNSSVMDTILDGLYSAYGEGGLLHDDTEFSIELRSNKAFFPGVPLSVILEKNILSIAAFRERS